LLRDGEDGGESKADKRKDGGESKADKGKDGKDERRKRSVARSEEV